MRNRRRRRRKRRGERKGRRKITRRLDEGREMRRNEWKKRCFERQGSRVVGGGGWHT